MAAANEPAICGSAAASRLTACAVIMGFGDFLAAVLMGFACKHASHHRLAQRRAAIKHGDAVIPSYLLGGTYTENHQL